MKIEFDKLDEIPLKMKTLLKESLDFQDHIILAQSLECETLIDQIKMFSKYHELKCNSWICHDCFENDYGIAEHEIVCNNCGTVNQVNKYWANTYHQQPQSFQPYGLETTKVVRKTRLESFVKLLNTISDCDIKQKMVQDFKNLEQKFDVMKDIHKRKNFFMEKLIFARLKDHYKLEKSEKQYDMFNQLNWPI